MAGVTALVVGAGVAAIGAEQTRPGWQHLPDPARTVIGGQTIGQTGGTGPGQLTLLDGATRGDVTVAFVCKGGGMVAFSAGPTSLGGGECFDGQPVSFSTTTPVTSLPFWIDVEAPVGVDWRISVSIE